VPAPARVAALAAGAALVAACGAHTPTHPPAPTPSSVVATSTSPLPPDVPVGARPFGLPVTIGAASVVVRAVVVYAPQPPIPGHDGTPVRAQVVVNAADGTPPVALHAALRDPTTGRHCVPLRGATPPFRTVPGRTALRAFSFLCPEVVQSDLLITVGVDGAQQTFYGPVS
jgi:hypothetical protein